jgi:hypothetical protein
VGTTTQYAIKQVDRLLSNPGIDVDELSKPWIAHAVGPRPKIVAALDWTDFDADDQATIMLSLVTNLGRSTPLVWLTVDKATLKNHRNGYEYRVLVQLAEALPADVKVLIVADRGFGDQKLYQVLTEGLKFDYLIRFRGNIAVTSAGGETRPAADWVGGRPPGPCATPLSRLTAIRQGRLADDLCKTSVHKFNRGSIKQRSVAGTDRTTGSGPRSRLAVEYSVSTIGRTTALKSAGGNARA